MGIRDRTTRDVLKAQCLYSEPSTRGRTAGVHREKVVVHSYWHAMNGIILSGEQSSVLAIDMARHELHNWQITSLTSQQITGYPYLLLIWNDLHAAKSTSVGYGAASVG